MPHIDDRSSNDPGHLVEPCISGVIVGKVLQIAGNGIEAKPASG